MSDVTLREYVEALFAEREKQVKYALEAVNRATEKAEAEALRAREAQNQWAATMTDLAGRFASVASVNALRAQQEANDRTLSRLVGAVVLLAALLPVATVVLSHFIN